MTEQTTQRGILFRASSKDADQVRPFLSEFDALDPVPLDGRSYGAVVSLTKQTMADAAAAAKLRGLPHRIVVDGLLRSVGSAAPTISRIVDDGEVVLGGRPSAIERALSAGIDDEDLLQEARSLLRFKQDEGLSRVNGLPPLTAPLPEGASCVLVVDYAMDDAFLGQRVALPEVYKAMLRRARQEHPQAHVIVQSDSRQHSAFDDSDLAIADSVIADPVDPADLIGRVDAVYTVGSILGFEAVLAGRDVTCFGAPFYAGWGLTHDEAQIVGRDRPQTRESLFAASYIAAARYVDPFTGEPCGARVAFERMAAFRRHARRVAGDWVALNIPPPKQWVLRSFLEGPMSTYAARPGRAPRQAANVRFAAWTSRPNGAVRQALATRPGTVTHIEDGFLRSVGLGSGFQPAASLVIDSRGAYYDPSRPSDLTEILRSAEFGPDLLARAARLRNQIVGLGLSKYNLGAADAPPVTPPKGARVLLVTGQVENDRSLLTAGGGMTNLALLERVRAENPRAYVIYKEHPDVTAGHRPGRISVRQAARLADEVIGPANITRLIEAADELHTITSLSGFEALLREKVVVTYGRPFYAGWGLTKDQARAEPHPRSLSLDALVAGALMLYPLYLDPVTRLPCDALTFVNRLAMLRDTSPTRIPASAFGGVSRYIEAIRHTFWSEHPPAY